MGTSEDWQASSVQIAGLKKQLDARGLTEKVLARCSPQTQAVMRDAYRARWHAGTVLVEVSMSIVTELGEDGFAQLNYEMTRASFGPILRPMLQVALALTGRTPATVLSRVPAAVQTALKNVTITWTANGARAGTLEFIYPCDIHTETLSAWLGAMRFVEELCGQPLTWDEKRVERDRVVLRVSW
ncbi:MAG: hypothetical protein U0228_35255 [Myxococcaceae bacterium]